MKSMRVVNSDLIATTVAIMAFCAFSAKAAPDSLPNARFVGKVKVVDAQNKKVGFISLEDGASGGLMNFTADNRLFQVGVSKSGLHTPTLEFYESADCTGPVFFRVDPKYRGFMEEAIVKKQSGGYAVYLADTDAQEKPPTSLLSFRISTGTNIVLPEPGIVTVFAGCQTIDWPYGNGTYYFLDGEQIRPGKNVANLNFTPPFSLKK